MFVKIIFSADIIIRSDRSINHSYKDALLKRDKGASNSKIWPRLKKNIQHLTPISTFDHAVKMI